MREFLSLVMIIALVVPAQAGLGITPPARAPSPVIPVADGCSPGFHRNNEGHCRPNYLEREREERRYERLECPRGYHLGEGGRRCWPNRRSGKARSWNLWPAVTGVRATFFFEVDIPFWGSATRHFPPIGALSSGDSPRTGPMRHGWPRSGGPPNQTARRQGVSPGECSELA